jgi:glycosyltransferase involved in cell wall biosynthesis
MIVLTNDYNDVLISNGFNQKEIIIAKYKFVNSVPNDNDINDCIIHIFKISFIGRMSKEKGVHVLIDSLTKLKVSNFSIELKLYGRQHEELFELDEIIEKAQSNNINIKWHGEIDTCEIEKVLHQSHVLCIPSTVYEMSPLVIQEAFSIGIPVVGSNIGGISEYIKHGENGLLFDTGNSIELAKCFQFLIDHPYEYNKLTRNVKKSLGLSQLGVDFVNIYKKYNAQ